VHPVECPREQDVLDALASGRWPSRCDDALRRHPAACGICADLVEVAGPLLHAAGEEWSAVRVPSPGTVWWRAQLRARREAAREAERPVTIAQGLGWFSAVASLIALTWLAAPWLSGVTAMVPEIPWPALPALPALAVPESLGLPESIDLARWRWLVAAAIGWFLLAPLAIYFALLED